ncbi:sugar/nucleoside kinase (ribokinase family) [Prauserella sediminis]|uniref:Sugar/nucleoside kinase (Ribokinase family) n=1 Tax=Prauserella sediminis TaxID=577680 RepID=A0A839XT92_9PSEU|nr:PfkB family carbohydrate kinase [Prauserella sediminis]MBB3664238.1 sugar/nucleoside kinase (ribokinase family) [Prauserella sediminis]
MDTVVFVGAATEDAIAVTAHHPSPDERVVVDDLVRSGGGPAATAAVTAARLGVPAQVIAAVGDDRPGHDVIDGLDAAGVDTRHVRVTPHAGTQSVVVICSRSDATRAICTTAAPPVELDEAAAEAVRSADWVHVDHHGWPPVARLLADIPPSDRPRLSVDAGYAVDDLRCRPDEVTLYVPTADRLRAEYGSTDLDAALAACTAHTVVATDGANGSIGRDHRGRLRRVPGLPIEPVSTLGAGDVFHGALLTAVVRERPLHEAMAYAGIAAALSCRAVDGRSAISTDHEIETHLSELKEYA